MVRGAPADRRETERADLAAARGELQGPRRLGHEQLAFPQKGRETLLKKAMMAVLLAALPVPVCAADPEAFNPDGGPVKIVVGFQPGGIGDTVARLFSDAVQKRLGQRVVVENRSGANGMI